MAKLSSFQLTEDVVKFYDIVFKKIGYGPGVSALEEVILNRKARDPFPSVADLKKIASKECDELDEAIEASNRVIESVSKFGGCNADINAPQARQFVGEIGWYVIKRNGGFVALCSLLDSRNITAMKAQFRDLALSAIKRYKQGLLDQAPSFERFETTSAKVKGLLSSAVKSIGGTDAMGTSGEGKGRADVKSIPGSGGEVRRVDHQGREPGGD